MKEMSKSSSYNCSKNDEYIEACIFNCTYAQQQVDSEDSTTSNLTKDNIDENRRKWQETDRDNGGNYNYIVADNSLDDKSLLDTEDCCSESGSQRSECACDKMDLWPKMKQTFCAV